MVTITEQVHPGQAEILDSPARFRTVACGRRWGKTELCAIEARDELCENGEGYLVWWVAPTYQQAKIGFRKFRKRMPDELMADINRSNLRIQAVTGAVIEFKSADRPDNLRGEGVDELIIDEMGDIAKYAWENALRPTLTDSDESRMIAIGTPKGRNMFHELFERGKSDDWPQYDSWNSPTTENPFISQSDVQEAKQTLPDRVFQQEYMAQFLDESGGVFTNIDENLFTESFAIDSYSGEGPYHIGVDLARHQDFRVIIAIDTYGTIVEFSRAQGETWPQIQREVNRVADTYPGEICIDASRDNKLVSDLEDDGLDITPVTFSPKTKTNLIENLIAGLEAKELSSTDINQLRHELSIFEYDTTRAGNIRYNAPEGFHDDCVDALALAYESYSTPTTPSIEDSFTF